MVNVKSDANTEDSRPHSLMGRFKTPIEYNPNGPLMSCMREPQLMVVKHREKSSYFKHRKENDDFNRSYNKKLAKNKIQCCGRYIKG